MSRIFNTYSTYTRVNGVLESIKETLYIFYSGSAAGGFDALTAVNICVYNDSGSNVTVTFKIYNSAGTQVGSTETYTAVSGRFTSIRATDLDVPEGGYLYFSAGTAVHYCITYHTWID